MTGETNNVPDRLEGSDDTENATDLDDSGGVLGLGLGAFDLRRLTQPIVVQTLAGIVIGCCLLIWPDRSTSTISKLAGLALLTIGLSSLWGALRRRPTRWLDVGLGGLQVAVALWIIFTTSPSDSALGQVLGFALAAMALRQLLHLFGPNAGGRTERFITLMTAVLLGAIGLGLFFFGTYLLGLIIQLSAIAWIVLSIVVLASALSNHASSGSYRNATTLIISWLESRPKSQTDRQDLYDKILFEGPNLKQRVIRFFVLMAFASIIASMGVITDSTAVVIGAMLIAPLMTPLMGMAISLVMGWPNRLKQSALLAFGGVTLAIGTGLILGLILPAVIDTSTNTQILARSSPTTLDLITALAAGAAGAYALSRPDVSDSLPGVAIAISLVPPLAVVGIAYSQGDYAAGTGSLLLFITNMLAILIMGGLTFLVTGVTPIRQVATNQHRVRTSLTAVATLAVTVFGLLAFNGTTATADTLRYADTQKRVTDWLSDDPKHRLVSIDREEDTVGVVVIGSADGLPDIGTLADSLSEGHGRPMKADVRLVVEERFVAGGQLGE